MPHNATIPTSNGPPCLAAPPPPPFTHLGRRQVHGSGHVVLETWPQVQPAHVQRPHHTLHLRCRGCSLWLVVQHLYYTRVCSARTTHSTCGAVVVCFVPSFHMLARLQRPHHPLHLWCRGRLFWLIVQQLNYT